QAQEDPFVLRGQELLLQGEYAAALEAFEEARQEATELTDSDRTQIWLGLCQLHVEQGDWTAAKQVAKAAVAELPNVARIWALQAEMQYLTGEYDAAARSVKEALDRDSQEPRSVLIYAHLLLAAGRTLEAIDQYRWFVRYYNRVQPTDAETLVTIGEGAAQYARLKSVSAVFKFIVNTLCVDALKDQPDYWPATLLSGQLLMEKYNRAQALPEFKAILAKQPHNAAALTAMGELEFAEFRLQTAENFADQALEHNPHYPPALRLKADLALLADDHELARPFVDRALAVNPADQLTLARKVTCDLLSDGVPEADQLMSLLNNLTRPEKWGELRESRFGTTVEQLVEHNPHPGPFLSDVGQLLEARRRFAAAELFYSAAIDRMPELSQPQTALGLLYMRTGRVDEAKSILDAAFDVDPFHVRVSNMRKLIDVLNTYVTIESDHFIIHCDSSEQALGQEMSAYLENIYTELTERFDYEPPTRTHFEIYCDAKDQNAHAWFSTRMSGLPWVQTIGASTGMIVALTSPQKTQKKFNWARVLKHEFVHVLTLQKTGFNMPHWYTEALAVTNEDRELPDEWYDLLLRRVPAGEVFNLSSINLGFQRPKTPDDWTMAYCQSLMYARYFTKTFGDDALARLTEAYRRNPQTSVALPKAFGVSVEEIEAGYSKYLNDLTAQLAIGRMPAAPKLDAARQAVAEHPERADAHGELAYALIARRQVEEGLAAAKTAHDLDESEPISATFLARVEFGKGDAQAALLLLQPALDEENPHHLLLETLADIAIEQKQPELAIEVLKAAIEKYPLELDVLKKYVQALSAAKRPSEEIRPHLETLAKRDIDDVASRKALAMMALRENDWATALEWGNQALFIDTLDVQLQRLVAHAAAQLKQSERSIQAFAVLDTLEELDDADRLQWGLQLKANGQQKRAAEEWRKIPRDSTQFQRAQTEIKLLDP
ncbi:MAG: tetratricopeptide repeat protein, partial [Planctomycetaceae bacterium]|nr:tetratricopeptide repeat protein [Planctomycetaceae bacterium]